MVAEKKRDMYSRGENKVIDFFVKVGGNEVKFRQAVDLWVGKRVRVTCEFLDAATSPFLNFPQNALICFFS